MSIFSLIGNYFLWHYSKAFVSLFRVWSNFVWFLYHFFSIPVLFRTLFSPWKKIHEEKQHAGFNLQDFLSVLIINTIMRIIGFFFRVVLIFIGALCIFTIFLALIVSLVVWLFAPVLIVLTFIAGIIFLFK